MTDIFLTVAALLTLFMCCMFIDGLEKSVKFLPILCFYFDWIEDYRKGGISGGKVKTSQER